MRFISIFLSVIGLMYGLFLWEINKRFDAAIGVLLFLFLLFIFIAIFETKIKNICLKNKWMLYTAGCILVIGVSFICFMEMKMYEAKKEEIPKDIDYVIVLGAGLKNGEVSLALKERLDKAYEYAKDKKIDIIVTGGTGYGEKRSEAYVMKEYLIEKGIKENRIITESKATSTYENLLYSKELILKNKEKLNNRIVIVTNDFHLYRSKWIAERLGFKSYGLAAKTPSVIIVQTHIREYMAIVKTWIFDR